MAGRGRTDCNVSHRIVAQEKDAGSSPSVTPLIAGKTRGLASPLDLVYCNRTAARVLEGFVQLPTASPLVPVRRPIHCLPDANHPELSFRALLTEGASEVELELV